MLSVYETPPLQACPAPFNLAAHVLAEGMRQPDRTALELPGAQAEDRWSFRRLDSAVRGFAGALCGMGLEPGDRLLLLTGNDPVFPVAFLGAIAAGIVPVPVPLLLTRPELAAVIAQIAPALILAGTGAALPDALPCPVLPAADVPGLAAQPPAPFDMGDPDRLAWMSYTSGTSGQPRAVMHAHRWVWARRMMRGGWNGLGPQDRLLHAGAFNWTYTLGTGLIDPWTVGATALIPAPGTRPEDLGELLRQTGATIFAAPPALLRRMLRHPLPPLPKLRHALSAGEKLEDDLARRWQAATGTPVHEAFGLSECSTFLSGCSARPAPPGTLGYAQDGRAIAILDAEGRPVPRGEPGTLAVHRRDPGLFLGYHGAPEETRARFAGDWFLTGDSASMAADGAITYLGRSDDMMNAGGARVSPLEVEAAMASFPGLAEVAAAEVRLESGVSVIACFYVAATLIPEPALAAHAAARLARYKQPRIFVRAESLPRSANHKLQRRLLRQEWERTHGRKA